VGAAQAGVSVGADVPAPGMAEAGGVPGRAAADACALRRRVSTYRTIATSMTMTKTTIATW